MQPDNEPCFYVSIYAADDVSTLTQWWRLPSLEGARFRYHGHASLGRYADLRDTYGCVIAHNMPAAAAFRSPNASKTA